MRQNLTTYQRAINQARKLQPNVRQVGSSMLFDVSSTSHLDQFYHVELSYNKVNPLKEAKCECQGPRLSPCLHRLAALLKYVANLEEKLWKGSDFIFELENNQSEPSDLYEKHLAIWLGMLDRYEKGCDLIKAVDAGQDIHSYTGKQKTGELSTENQQLAVSA